MGNFIDRTGEVGVAKNGLKMKIIEYKGYNDITVMFEDGYKKKSTYGQFLKGTISHPDRNIYEERIKAKANEYIGQTNKMNNGLLATIIDYRRNDDIDIQFSDGVKVYNKTYKSFKNGNIKHPNIDYHSSLKKSDRIGESRIAKNGLKMSIIGYRNVNDIDIMFEDGYVVKNIGYQHFFEGTVKHPNFNTKKHKSEIAYLHEKKRMNNGLVAEIVRVNGKKDIDVVFENGNRVNNRTYYDFEKGKISDCSAKVRMEGRVVTLNCGIRVKIIEYRSNKDITIQYEDGVVRNISALSVFEKGTHPSFVLVNGKYATRKGYSFAGYHNLKESFRSNDRVFYHCVNEEGVRDLLTPQMMMEKSGIKAVF